MRSRSRHQAQNPGNTFRSTARSAAPVTLTPAGVYRSASRPVTSRTHASPGIESVPSTAAGTSSLTLTQVQRHPQRWIRRLHRDDLRLLGSPHWLP
jgi:hypothetical protein